MNTYIELERSAGEPVQALLWDGKATSVKELPPELIERATVSFVTGELRIDVSEPHETLHMPVQVGEYLLITGRCTPVAMEPVAFEAKFADACERCDGWGQIHSPIIGVDFCSVCDGTGIDPDELERQPADTDKDPSR